MISESLSESINLFLSCKYLGYLTIYALPTAVETPVNKTAQKSVISALLIMARESLFY